MDLNEELKVLGKFKKNIFFWGGGGSGCIWDGLVGRVRVHVNEELKFFVKIQKKKFEGGGGVGGQVGRGSGWM